MDAVHCLLDLVHAAAAVHPDLQLRDWRSGLRVQHSTSQCMNPFKTPRIRADLPRVPEPCESSFRDRGRGRGIASYLYQEEDATWRGSEARVGQPRENLLWLGHCIISADHKSKASIIEKTKSKWQF